MGENGTGKSTLLEGIADLCGFNLGGGNRNHVFNRDQDQPTIAHALRGAWLPKVARGFFMRAEKQLKFIWRKEMAELASIAAKQKGAA